MGQIILAACIAVGGWLWHASNGGGLPAMAPLLMMVGGGIWLLIAIIRYARRTS